MWNRQPTSYTAATYQHFLWICHLAATFLQRSTSATIVEFFTSFQCTDKVLIEHVWYLQGTNGTYMVPARYQWNMHGTFRVPMKHMWYLQGTNGTCMVPAGYQWNIYGTCKVPMVHARYQLYMQGTNGTCKVPMIQPQSGAFVAARWQIHPKYWQVAQKWLVGCQFHKYL